MPILDFQPVTSAPIPSAADFEHWVEAALEGRREDWELGIRLVDAAESQQLNQQYRGKDRPTNVLSFPADLPAGVVLPLLGDLVICAPVVIKEAEAQRKLAMAHWAHLTVHGVLHLLGFDHMTDAQAEAMEAEERKILDQLGYADPYAEDLGG